MLNKIMVASLTAIMLIGINSVFADAIDPINSCKVVVSVSTPPVKYNESVFFNITSDTTNNSAVVNGGASSQTIYDLVCSQKSPYIISATHFSSPSNLTVDNNHPVGKCVLKAGPITLGLPGNSVSVVFPNDFICTEN
ncbi:MAG: hypothetical protein H0T84_04285 [Tatlockia sp.]|nr:hypothetical protein [Tatlockia sp.]